MGCCFYVPPVPDDPSIEVCAPVTEVIVKKADSLLTYNYGHGTVYVKGGIFIYKGRFRGQLSLYTKDIQTVTLERAFRDRGTYSRPCYCCTCTGCPDGMADIRGTANGVQVHIGLAMANAAEFVEQLQARTGEKATES